MKLAVPVKGDPTVISGESGAVGMGLIAALMETNEYKDLREAIGLDHFSQVLIRPAIMVERSPVTFLGLPSPARALW